MGYRHYLYITNKADVERIKSDTLEELETKYADEDGYYCIKDVIPQKEVFEFGKLYWDDTAEQIYNYGVPLFDNEDVMERFSDYKPYVVGKEALLKAIEIYESKVLNYYKGLLENGETYIGFLGIQLEDEKVTSEEKMKNHVTEKIRNLTLMHLVDTSDEKYSITNSWEYEHSIFNLAYLLKMIDWETQTLLFYGW